MKVLNTVYICSTFNTGLPTRRLDYEGAGPRSSTRLFILLGNIAMIVNILKMTSIRSDVLAIKSKTMDNIRSIMSDDDSASGHGRANTPFLSNATLSWSGDALIHPGSLDEAIALRLMLIRQRKIINAFNHDYTIQPSNSCAGRQIDLVMGVTVPADDFVARGQYRSLIADNYSMSWSEKLGTLPLFFIGLPSPSSGQKDAQRSILVESKRFNDIVQGDYPDNPGNLNAKTRSMLRWVTKNCPSAKFVVKASSECNVNIPMVLEELTKTRRKHHLFMLGHLASEALMKKMEAGPESAIPYSIYKLEYYPAFLTGGAVGYPMEVAALLYQSATRLPAFQLEEVFFTGICADFINVPRLDNPAMYFNDCYDDPK
ncbi:hypothetical protein Btru_042242 [Bulinus truncatus]|nr:hypothetical protein Btru_042242 [Bulinus truncatus]